MKKYLEITVVCILLVGFLAGCTNRNGNKKKQKNTKEAVQLMSPSELTTLNTSVLLDFPNAIVQTAVFKGLYSLGEQDQLVPAVAKALPTISEDRETYTISLRKEAVWSDDDPATAHDFEYAWEKMIDPKNGFVYSFLIVETIQNGAEISAEELAPNELGVTAVDDYILKATLKEPKPYFTSLLAFSIFFPQNQKVVERFGADYGTASDKVVYNGPFMVKDWQQIKMDWQLAKNNRCWDHQDVRSDIINYTVIKETSTALSLFEDGQLDVATLSGELTQQNKNNTLYHSYPTAIMNYLRLNQKRKGQATPLANENLRKTLALGIDKEDLVNNIIVNGSKALHGTITEGLAANLTTGLSFRQEADNLMVYNKEKAQSYWKEAQTELGEKVNVELTVTDSGSYKKIDESLQDSLQELSSGLTIELAALPTEAALNFGRESDCDLFLIYWTPGYQDPIFTLMTLYEGNDRDYQNPVYDRLLDETATTYALEPEKRWATLIVAEKEVIETTAGMIPLSQNEQTVLQNDKVKGSDFHTFGAPLTLKNVYKEK